MLCIPIEMQKQLRPSNCTNQKTKKIFPITKVECRRLCHLVETNEIIECRYRRISMMSSFRKINLKKRFIQQKRQLGVSLRYREPNTRFSYETLEQNDISPVTVFLLNDEMRKKPSQLFRFRKRTSLLYFLANQQRSGCLTKMDNNNSVQRI